MLAVAESFPKDCPSSTEMSDMLLLLQRQALSHNKHTGISLIDETVSKDGLDLDFRAKARRVEISFYNDSECTIQEGAEIFASAESDYCALDWNFTCGCELNNQVILASHYDNCTTKNVISETSIPVGLCVPGPRIASSPNLYVFVRDMKSCPCCGAQCTVYGDPHITVFDNADVALLKTPKRSKAPLGEFDSGDFWLVKSELVYVQARYRHVEYNVRKHAASKPNKDPRAFLTGLAVGGPFLQGHSLRIGPLKGKVEWVTEGVAESILENPGSFKVDTLLEAHFRPHGRLVKDPDMGATAKSFTFHLPSGVKLEVNRFKKHMDVSISMSAEAGGPDGVDGQCGNFNGDASDDTAQLIEERLGGEIPIEELLFAEANDTDSEEATENVTANVTVNITVNVSKNATTASLTQTASGGRFQAISPVATAEFYKDSSCEMLDTNGKVSFSVDQDHCELGWNFTCACSEDSRAVYATLMSPDCMNGTAAAIEKIPAGECMDGSRFSGFFYQEQAPYFMLNADACPSCCDGAACTIHGDPHITVFDNKKVQLQLVKKAKGANKAAQATYEDMFGSGDFWLVKSDMVLIQARYHQVWYPHAKQPLNQTYLTSIAVAGTFLRGHKLIVEPRSGEATWVDDEDKHTRLCEEVGDNFTIAVPDVILKCHNRTALVPKAYAGKTIGLDVHLPSGVKLRVDRFGKHLDARVIMPRDAGGPGEFDGQCGNFNGDAEDDTAELIGERMGDEVPEDEVLFEKEGVDETPPPEALEAAEDKKD